MEGENVVVSFSIVSLLSTLDTTMHPSPSLPPSQAIDLDPYDQELLGTIMVRICNCGCARQDTRNLSSSSPSASSLPPSIPPSPPRVDSLTLMSEILRGAHIVVEEDRGAFYSWFTHMQDSYRRTSSHSSIVPMYGIDEGSVLRTILTGKERPCPALPSLSLSLPPWSSSSSKPSLC